MTEKMVPSTQSQLDDVTLDAVKLAEEMGLPLEEEPADKVASRKSILLSNATLLSLTTLLSSPVILNNRGWKLP
jgi:hypothetical protein